MAKPERTWEVTPHDPIEKLDDNLWAVRTQLPAGRNGSRRMVMARLGDGRIVFYNAAPLDDASLEQLSDWGTPAFLVLPSNLHMMDGAAFAQRLNLKIYGPRQDTKMAARVPLAGTLEDFPADPLVSTVGAAGTKNGEAILSVRSPDQQRLSLAFADMFMNIPSAGASLMSRVIGFTGGPKVPGLMKLMVLKDRHAFKAQLSGWAADQTLARLIPSHGDLVSTDTRATLQGIAEQL